MRDDGPAGLVNQDLLRRMERRGGVAREAGALLAHGFDRDGVWCAGTVDLYLGLLDDRIKLRHSTEVLRVATDEPEFDTATMDLIDALLDAYSAREVGSLIDWVAIYADEVVP